MPDSSDASGPITPPAVSHATRTAAVGPSPPSPSPSSSYTQRSTRSQIRLTSTIRANDGRRGSLSGDDDDDGDNVYPRIGRIDIDARRSQGSPAGDGGDDDDDDAQSQASSEADSLLRRRRILVGKDWDDSDDEDDDDYGDGEEDEEGASAGDGQGDLLRADFNDGGRSSTNKRARRAREPDSYLHTLRPSRERRRSWWKYLTNPAQPNTLSIPHVTLNLFAASLHPSVLLSTPFYFSRTGLKLGLVGLSLVAVLGGVGGGLWVVLSRYVGGKKTPEAITGASFGRHSKHKSKIGKLLAGIMLATYSTGSAFIAYFALADLLLQVFFHYSPKGIPLHDRAFVTLVVGAMFTAPLIVVPLAKRTLIRLAMGASLVLYPIILAILFAKVYTLGRDEGPDPAPDLSWSLGSSNTTSMPNGNPLRPPSIWAPYSLLPLLTLSSSPLQILAHNRSLRRKLSLRAQGAQQGSNVKAFLACQALQVLLVIGTIVAFGVGIGTKGIGERLGWEIRPNLFTSLPHDDDLINVARLGFVFLLSTHLALCLAMSRSSWARLLKLLNLNPFKWARRSQQGRIRLEGAEGQSVGSSADEAQGGGRSQSSAGARSSALRRKQWGKLARTSLGGALLWFLVAFLAYTSGVGGIRRREKAGEEARYVRASEVLGLFGGGVGFVLPGVVWVLLFWVRRQREILGDTTSFNNAVVGAASSAWASWVKGPLGVLARRTQRSGGASSASTATTRGDGPRPQTNPIPTWHQERALPREVGHPPPPVNDSGAVEVLASEDATRILLARKERQLQRRTKERRLWQDVLVLAGVLPLGFLLLIMGAIELGKGGF